MVVTISREYGAAGLAVADGVARALGYALMTDDVPAAVAARLGTSADEVASRATAQAPLAERMLGDMGAATPEAVAQPVRSIDPFEDDVRREIERTIRERAAQGDVVVLGRVASEVLAGMPGLLRVFLTASRAWRIERLMETFHFTRQQAEKELERVDVQRRKFSRDRYKIAWGDPRHYDLIADTERFGIDGTVAVIVAAVNAVGGA